MEKDPTGKKQFSRSLLNEIRRAGTLDEIRAVRGRLSQLVASMLDDNIPIPNICAYISDFANAVFDMLLQFAIRRQGPPPVPFAFMVMGSQCRREQTLITDQDNAIVFEDVAREPRRSVTAYFLRLGETVCGWLDEVGYTYCHGDFMAQNPQWCQPLSRWKTYYSQWILGIEPEAQVRFGLFFDFCTAYGEHRLTDELRRHLLDVLADSRGFFLHLSEIARRFKSPVSIFGHLKSEKKAGLQNALDIKSAMEPIVFITRLYAYLNKIEEVESLQRLDQLLERKILTLEEHHEIVQAYNSLMKLRLLSQVTAASENRGQDANLIVPEKLSSHDRVLLKKSLRTVKRLQRKMRSLKIREKGHLIKVIKPFSVQ